MRLRLVTLVHCYLAALLMAIVLQGCASRGDISPQDRASATATSFKERSLSEHQAHLGVRVAALSAAESEKVFALPLAKSGIQPIWVEIDNRSGHAETIFFPITLDKDYFSPFELAWKYRHADSERNFEQLGLELKEAAMPLIVPPKTTASGFVFANMDQGAKAVIIDLIGADREQYSFEFIVEVPGLKADFLEKDFDSMFGIDDFIDVNEAELRKVLRSLPCCVAGGDRETPGDPINIVVIGEVGDGEVLFPFVRRGWDLTETVSAGSVWNTVKSSLFRYQYRYSPISPLYLFGRSQDVALQKARKTVDERNHLRLWASPYRYKGMHVFVGQISRDIGVRLSSKTLVTHKIDPDVDEARDYLAQDLIKSQRLKAFGYVGGQEAIDPASPAYNYTGDPYWTDGLLAVFIISDDTAPANRMSYFDW